MNGGEDPKQPSVDRLAWADSLYAAVEVVGPGGSPMAMAEAFCQAIVAGNRYSGAGIALAIAGEGLPMPTIAAAGAAKDYVQSLRFSGLADRPAGLGPGGQCYRLGRAVITNAVLSEPTFGPWIEKAVQSEVRSSLAIPLIKANRVIGVLSIYSAKPNTFSEADASFFLEVALKVAAALPDYRHPS